MNTEKGKTILRPRIVKQTSLLTQLKGLSGNPRSTEDIFKDMNKLWREDKLGAVKLTLYLRSIPKFKHEALMRWMWIATVHKDIFITNFPYWLKIGNWFDVIEMMSLDLEYHGYYRKRLPWNELIQFIKAGLINPHTYKLVRQCLPVIRSINQCNTTRKQAHSVIGKEISREIFGKPEQENCYRSYTLYRKLRNGTTKISDVINTSISKYLNFDLTNPVGRSLAILTGSDYLKHLGIDEEFQKWIATLQMPKYTGFAYESLIEDDCPNTVITEKRLAIIEDRLEQVVTKCHLDKVYIPIIDGRINSFNSYTKCSNLVLTKTIAFLLSKSCMNRYMDMSGNMYAIRNIREDLIFNFQLELDINIIKVVETLKTFRDKVDMVSGIIKPFPNLLLISDKLFDCSGKERTEFVSNLKTLLMAEGIDDSVDIHILKLPNTLNDEFELDADCFNTKELSEIVGSREILKDDINAIFNNPLFRQIRL